MQTHHFLPPHNSCLLVQEAAVLLASYVFTIQLMALPPVSLLQLYCQSNEMKIYTK